MAALQRRAGHRRVKSVQRLAVQGQKQHFHDIPASFNWRVKEGVKVGRPVEQVGTIIFSPLSFEFVLTL